MKFLALTLSLVVLLSRAAQAGAQEGVDFTDGIGGLVGLLGVLFFAYLCFRGDKHPPEGIGKK